MGTEWRTLQRLIDTLDWLQSVPTRTREEIEAAQTPDMSEPLLSASSAVGAEPLPDLPHDLVDLERLQQGRFLFQLRTPFRQYLVRSLSLVVAFANNLLDGHFPVLKTHQLFLFDFRVAH